MYFNSFLSSITDSIYISTIISQKAFDASIAVFFLYELAMEVTIFRRRSPAVHSAEYVCKKMYRPKCNILQISTNLNCRRNSNVTQSLTNQRRLDILYFLLLPCWNHSSEDTKINQFTQICEGIRCSAS